MASSSSSRSSFLVTPPIRSPSTMASAISGSTQNSASRMSQLAFSESGMSIDDSGTMDSSSSRTSSGSSRTSSGSSRTSSGSSRTSSGSSRTMDSSSGISRTPVSRDSSSSSDFSDRARPDGSRPDTVSREMSGPPERAFFRQRPVRTRDTESTVFGDEPINVRGLNISIEVQRLIVSGQPIPSEIAQKFYDLPTNQENRLILSSALEVKSLDPDNVLLNYIYRARDVGALYAVAIALRNGANPNIYVKYGQRSVHILIYVYMIWRERYAERGRNDELLKTLVITLIVMGSNPMLPADETGKDSMYVSKWLTEKRYPHILNIVYPEYQTGVESNTLRHVAIITGRLELLAGTSLSENSIELILESRVTDQYPEILDYLPFPSEITGLDYKILFLAVSNYNEPIIRYYAERGLLISYPLMVSVILRVRQYQNRGDVLLESIYIDMIQDSVRHGFLIDTEQMNLLTGLPEEDYQIIVDEYKKPYWQKVCSANSIDPKYVPERLETLARHLGIEDSQNKEAICRALKSISDLPLEEAKKAALERSKARMVSLHGHLSEFTGSSLPDLVIYNRASIDGDPFDYTDLAMSFFRDSQDKVWAVSSDNYEAMLKTGKNPVTKEELPEQFLTLINYKLAKMKSYGFNPRKPAKYSEILDSLNKEDTISDHISDEVYRQFLDILAEKGMTKSQFEKLTNEDLYQAVESSGYRGNIQLLTDNHGRITTAYIVTGFMRYDPVKADNIVKAITRPKIVKTQRYVTPVIPGRWTR